MSPVITLDPDMACLALGSNLGDRVAMMLHAVAALSGHGRLVGLSRLYETDPIGPAQPDYLNAALLLRTPLEPTELLKVALATERLLLRERVVRHGPRTIDVDILLHGTRTMRSAELTLPHPGLELRAFVLKPLSDLVPNLLLASGRTVEEACAQCKGSEGSVRDYVDARWLGAASGMISSLR